MPDKQHRPNGFSTLEAVIAVMILAVTFAAMTDGIGTSMKGLSRAQEISDALRRQEAQLALITAMRAQGMREQAIEETRASAATHVLAVRHRRLSRGSWMTVTTPNDGAVSLTTFEFVR